MGTESFIKKVNDLLGGRGLKASRRRDAVLQAVFTADKHMTVVELGEKVKKVDPKVGHTTVWRTLKLLESMGMVLPHKFHDEQTRYECVKGEGHHDHLICTSCGQVEEFLNQKMEEMQKRVAAAHKFSITSHRMEIYGICKACKSKKS